MNWRRFSGVLVARNLEFLRDTSSLAWNILFPVLIVVGFAFAFSSDRLDLYKVGIFKGDDSHLQQFQHTRYIQFIPVTDLQLATTRVQRHQLDMLVDFSQQRFWINDSSPKGYMLERVLLGSGGENFTRQTVSGRQIRYVDWLIPGVLGMNMMFSALFGVGYVIVRYRKNGVLKRLKATPLTAFEFLAAQVVSRMGLILAITSLVYLGTDYFIDFSMYGSYLNLLLVLALGAFCLISMGLVVAARVRSEELAGGLLNMVTWPMMFLSGVWFSLEGLQPWVQKLALIFPLTHITEAARAIMIDGAGLAGIAPHLLVLALMSIFFLFLGSWAFRWE
jgi:ABC-type multidrug transport system permease subunit